MGKTWDFYKQAEMNKFLNVVNSGMDRIERHKQLEHLARGMQTPNGVLLPSVQRRIDFWKELNGLI